jgi:hypothetical protein
MQTGRSTITPMIESKGVRNKIIRNKGDGATKGGDAVCRYAPKK